MNREFYYISLFNNRFIGDDGAYIDSFVYSADAFCEDIHFKREWMSLKEIAKKAVAVNVSDAVAMNAEPKYALITISIPKNFSKKEFNFLARGFQEAAKEFGFEIIGGDTVASKRLDISIALVSQTKKPIFRNGLKDGYLIGYTGELGSVKRDLMRLMRGKRVSKKSKFIKPRIRREFMIRSARVLKSAMDISDGLFDDLSKISNINKKGIKLFSKISKRIGCSGEEYEILFAIDPRDKKALLQRAKSSRTKVRIIGKVTRGKWRNPCKPHHF